MTGVCYSWLLNKFHEEGVLLSIIARNDQKLTIFSAYVPSRPQSCDPFGQHHGSRALAGSESRKSANHGLLAFCAASETEFETITATIGYNNGQLLRLRVILALPELSIRDASQKDRSSGDGNGICNFRVGL